MGEDGVADVAELESHLRDMTWRQLAPLVAQALLAAECWTRCAGEARSYEDCRERERQRERVCVRGGCERERDCLCVCV